MTSLFILALNMTAGIELRTGALLSAAEKAIRANKLFVLAQDIFERAGDGVSSISVNTDEDRLVLEKGIHERYSDTRVPIKEVLYDFKRYHPLSLFSIRQSLVEGPNGQIIDTDQGFRKIEDQLNIFFSAINNGTAQVAKMVISQ